MPRGGAAIELGEEGALAVRKFVPEQVTEEVVVAVPLPARVEWHQEEVRAVDIFQLRARVVASGHRIAKRRAHPLEDRRAG
jgi:hypothetical protein